MLLFRCRLMLQQRKVDPECCLSLSTRLRSRRSLLPLVDSLKIVGWQTLPISPRARVVEPRVGVFNRHRRGVVSIWSMFVFLTMPTLYLDGRLTGFAKATKTCPAHKLYWRPLNWKRSLPVLKWTCESEYFFEF